MRYLLPFIQKVMPSTSITPGGGASILEIKPITFVESWAYEIALKKLNEDKSNKVEKNFLITFFVYTHV
jgi:hypothetical protein